jgi:hypothetical protein
MKQSPMPVVRKLRYASLLLTLLLALLLSACASYSAGGYYSTAGYYSQPNSVYYHRPYTYYGRYQPGWFVAGPYFPGNYWGYGGMVYWPTYSSSYYFSNHFYGGGHYGRNYPYWDPWYSGYGGYYRPVYGPYYGYGGGYWHGSYGGRPYPGNSHSYRPPGHQDYQRPDPVVIPRDQRGDYGAPGGYSDGIDYRQRQRELRQPERRSATVVTERDGMSRSVIVAPVADGSSGMVVSSRAERKAQPSRLHPATGPARQSPPAGNAAPVFQAPGRDQPVQIRNTPSVSRPEPSFNQRLDSNSVNNRPDRPPRDAGDRGHERDRDQRRQ